MNNITEGLLAAGHQVKVVAVETPKHPVVLKAFAVDYLQSTCFESVFIDTTPRFKDAIQSTVKGQAYQIGRFYSKSMSSKLIQILKNESFDIIHLESIYVIPYISLFRKYSKAKIVLRLHNIEHQIWERLAQNEHFLIKKMIYYTNARQLKKVEETILSQVDGYMTISEPDYSYFHEKSPEVKGLVIPFGLNMKKYEDEDDYIPSDEPSLFHLGSMNWSPNVEGIEWFLDEVWPEIHEKYPTLTFTMAGHHIPDKFYHRKDKQVNIVGSVPDANEFMLDHDIMVVPLLAGSGVRIKIVEAMALGKVVITTTVGAEGLDVENGKHLFIADKPE